MPGPRYKTCKRCHRAYSTDCPECLMRVRDKERRPRGKDRMVARSITK